jgi:hypothetical protein
MLGIGESDEKGFLSISTDLEYCTTGGKVGARDGYMNFPIYITALDNFFKTKNNRIGLLKIDVEGFEDKVLAGAKKIIAEDKPTIFFECLDDAAGERVYNLLSSFGYKFWEIDDQQQELISTNQIKSSKHPDGSINMNKLNRIASHKDLVLE